VLSLTKIDWEQETIFSLELISIGKKIEKKMKKEQNMNAMGVKGGLVRNRRYARLIALCYQIASPPKTKDKNNRG
jgi:hypothetical protein